MQHAWNKMPGIDTPPGMAMAAIQGFGTWYFNSGALHHMTSHQHIFLDLKQIQPTPITIATFYE